MYDLDKEVAILLFLIVFVIVGEVTLNLMYSYLVGTFNLLFGLY